MIQLLPQLNILFAYQPVDFRKGVDGLIGLCRAQFDAELYDGTLYVFRNRRGTALRIICFDGVGWWLFIRRFSQGRLQWWPKALADTLTRQLEAQQLQVLIYNGLPEQASFVSPWRSLRPSQAANASASSSPSPSPL
jgi:transposase